MIYLFLPLSCLYALYMRGRRWAYEKKFLQSQAFPLPVVIIGNITVGGTGKTPVLAAIAQKLKAQGYQPGIVSRGFGGQSTKWPQFVEKNSDPKWVGDEPVLLARKTGCPVVVAPKRVAAVQALLAKYPCDLILSDDGLQHYALCRDIEIHVIESARGLGNGLCLPAGPLREPVSRLKEVDMHLLHVAGEHEIAHKKSEKQRMFSRPEYPFYLAPRQVYNLEDSNRVLPLAVCAQYHWKAVAGIGHPERFFKQLEGLGWKIEGVALPDHHIFSEQDIQCSPDQQIIMTEKDAVKCQGFAHARCWVFPVEATLAEVFYKQLLARIEEKKKATKVAS